MRIAPSKLTLGLLLRLSIFSVSLCFAMTTAAQSNSEDRFAGATISYVVVDGVSIPNPLTQSPGSASRGEQIFSDPNSGGCAGCHALQGKGDTTQIGPSLAGVGGRLSRSALRLWIVNPTYFKPETKMPGYYALFEGDMPEPSRTKTRLDAQAIEDLVVFLDNLKPIGVTVSPINRN